MKLRRRNSLGQFVGSEIEFEKCLWPSYEFKVKRSYLSMKQLKNGQRVFAKEVAQLMQSRRLLRKGDGVEEVRQVIAYLKRSGNLPLCNMRSV